MASVRSGVLCVLGEGVDYTMGVSEMELSLAVLEAIMIIY